MDGVDEVRVAEQTLSNNGTAETALNFLARHVGVREDADALGSMGPLSCQNGEFRNDQGCLATAWTGGHVERGACGEKCTARRIKNVQPPSGHRPNRYPRP